MFCKYKAKYNLFIEFLLAHKLFFFSSIVSQIFILFYLKNNLKPSIITFVNNKDKSNGISMIIGIFIYVFISLFFNILHKIYLSRHCLKASMAPILHTLLTQWRFIPIFIILFINLINFPIILFSGIIMLFTLLLVKNQWPILIYIIFLMLLQCFFFKEVIMYIGMENFKTLSLLYPFLIIGNNIHKAYNLIHKLLKEIQ